MTSQSTTTGDRLRLAIIGGGNMAPAILAGATGSGLNARFVVVEPDETKHAGLPNPHATLAAGFADLCAAEARSGGGPAASV